jgi:hypothetical protein
MSGPLSLADIEQKILTSSLINWCLLNTVLFVPGPAYATLERKSSKLPGRTNEICAESIGNIIIATGYKVETTQYLSYNRIFGSYEGIKSCNNGAYIEAAAAAGQVPLSIPPLVFTGIEPVDASPESLIRDSTAIVDEAKRGQYYSSNLDHVRKSSDQRLPLLLLGHSRGGAVMALATVTFAKELLTSQLLLRARMKKAHSKETPRLLPAAPLLTVLLDPVDTPDRYVASQILGTLKDSKSSRWPFPMLIVSTPYGGGSAYYKTKYDSACAPQGRNADVFYQAFTAGVNDEKYAGAAQREGAQQHQANDYNSSLPDVDKVTSSSMKTVVMMTLPDVGHMQLLDAREGAGGGGQRKNRRRSQEKTNTSSSSSSSGSGSSATGSSSSVFTAVCAANNAIEDSRARDLVQNVIQMWSATAKSRLNDDNGTGGAELVYGIDDTDLMSIKEYVRSSYPDIVATWQAN